MTGLWAGRLLLLLVVAGAAAVAFWIARAPVDGSPGGLYSCPMHPAVSAGAAGACPICGMALRPRAPDELDAPPAPAPGTVASGDADAEFDPSRVAIVRTRTFTREVRAPAWVADADDGTVMALLYQDEIEGLAPDERAQFKAGAPGATTFAVHLAGTPTEPWDGATSHVAFRLDGSTATRAGRPSPGDAGWLVLAARPRARLVVPYGAVLSSAAGPYVLIATGAGGGQPFERRPVRIGSVVNDLAVAIDGLRAGDRVALRDAFFLDAEQRARRAGAEPPP